MNSPEAAVDIFLKHYPNVDRRRALGAWKSVMDIVVSDETKAHGLGWQDPAVLAKQAQFMLENKLIPAAVAVTKVFTNDYLPGK